MQIERGGQIESLKNDKKLLIIDVMFDKDIQLWLNESSLSYLSIEEAIKLRNDLNNALMSAVLRQPNI
jgi:hypothetical protein